MTSFIRSMQSLGDISADQLSIAQSIDISLEHADFTSDTLESLSFQFISSYGDCVITKSTISQINAELYHGSLITSLQGSLNDFYIQTNTEHGENSLPTEYHQAGKNRIKINTEYGDINVTFPS